MLRRWYIFSVAVVVSAMSTMAFTSHGHVADTNPNTPPGTSALRECDECRPTDAAWRDDGIGPTPATLD